MDVIFDLHYYRGDAFDTSGVPPGAHDLLDLDASDPFFQDEESSNELYNEPTQDSAGLKTWMQTTFTAIRAKGAK